MAGEPREADAPQRFGDARRRVAPGHAAQAERQGLAVEGAGDVLKGQDGMLAEYSIMSASATLEDAVVQARHTLQDVFPVVRAGNMVGAVSRAEIMQALESTGNGYVQGIMARTFSTAAPGDGLVATLGRALSSLGEKVLLADATSHGLLPFYFGASELRPGVVRRSQSARHRGGVQPPSQIVWRRYGVHIAMTG